MLATALMAFVVSAPIAEWRIETKHIATSETHTYTGGVDGLNAPVLPGLQCKVRLKISEGGGETYAWAMLVCISEPNHIIQLGTVNFNRVPATLSVDGTQINFSVQLLQ